MPASVGRQGGALENFLRGRFVHFWSSGSLSKVGRFSFSSGRGCARGAIANFLRGRLVHFWVLWGVCRIGLSQASDTPIGTKDTLDFFRRRRFHRACGDCTRGGHFLVTATVGPWIESGLFRSWRAVSFECSFQRSGPGKQSLLNACPGAQASNAQASSGAPSLQGTSPIGARREPHGGVADCRVHRRPPSEQRNEVPTGKRGNVSFLISALALCQSFGYRSWSRSFVHLGRSTE